MSSAGRKKAQRVAPLSGRALVPASKREASKIPLWRDALYEHVARRLLNHHPIATIASAIGYSESHVRTICKRPEFIDVYKRIRKELYQHVDDVLMDQRAAIADRIEASAPVALSKVIALMENAHSDRVKLDAAVRLLDLAGHTPVQKRITADVPLARLSDEDLGKLAEAFRLTDTETVDAEVVQ